MKVNLVPHIEATGPQVLVDGLHNGLPLCENGIRRAASMANMTIAELEDAIISDFLSGYATAVLGKPCDITDEFHLQEEVLTALKETYRNYFDTTSN